MEKTRVRKRISGLVAVALAAGLVQAAGLAVFSQPLPGPSPSLFGYGDFGGPGNPYGPYATAEGGSALAGPFSDQVAPISLAS